MTNWLANPAELGRPPKRIELAGEFMLHGMTYYIFKFKKSAFGRWLLGVAGGYEAGGMEHCGHVFSEFQPYIPETAQQQAGEIVDSLRQYWIQQANAMNTKDSFYL